jgi:hypothetical protein
MYCIVSAAGGYAARGTFGTATTWRAGLATYREAAPPTPNASPTPRPRPLFLPQLRR